MNLGRVRHYLFVARLLEYQLQTKETATIKKLDNDQTRNGLIILQSKVGTENYSIF